MISAQFSLRYAEVGRAAGRQDPVSPYLDLRQWHGFARECVAGYDGDLAGYRAGLSMRRLIQHGLDDEGLRAMDDFAAFREEVERADEVFRSVATIEVPSAVSWWDLVVPRYGGEQFASELRQERGLEISVRAADGDASPAVAVEDARRARMAVGFGLAGLRRRTDRH